MTLAWILFSLYVAVTSYLGWLGYKKTGDFASFAIGKGDMSPFVVGITLATSTASAATFIINPGFIYVDGLAAWMHLGVSVFIGILFMLFLLSFSFRRQGEKMKALTIPDWIGKRYGSRPFALYFALLNLLAFAFIVLLVGGISIVMQKMLGVDNTTALIITLVFVTSYVILGGTYAHVYTNMFQGFLMVGVSVLIVGAGLKLWLFDGVDIVGKLNEVDPNLLAWVNPGSKLFDSTFSIYIAGFVIGAALVCQPHILTKALYVKRDRDVRRYIYVFAGTYLLFTLLLLAGFFAHVVVPDEALLDPATGNFRQDLVMTAYLQYVFPDWMFTVISVVLLAAAMSTLDGLMVGISTITSNDLIMNVVEMREKGPVDKEKHMKWALRSSNIVLVVIAIATFFVNLNPPKLLGIFGQVGVYGLVLAVVPPLMAGVLFKQVNLTAVWALSVLGVVLHFGLYFFGSDLFPDLALNVANPGVTAAVGCLAGSLPALALGFVQNRRVAPASAP